MKKTRKLDVDPGYLYLSAFYTVDSGIRNMGAEPVLNGYRVNFGNSSAQISFTIPEDMVHEIIDCDAIVVEISTVKSEGAE